MPGSFDPYTTWLGVRPSPPAHYYALLGLDPFESEPPIISEAVERQTAKVMPQLTGSHAALAQQVLTELLTAKVVLLNPTTRGQYDQELAETLGGSPRPPTGSGPVDVSDLLPPAATPALPQPAAAIPLAAAVAVPTVSLAAQPTVKLAAAPMVPLVAVATANRGAPRLPSAALTAMPLAAQPVAHPAAFAGRYASPITQSHPATATTAPETQANTGLPVVDASRPASAYRSRTTPRRSQDWVTLGSLAVIITILAVVVGFSQWRHSNAGSGTGDGRVSSASDQPTANGRNSAGTSTGASASTRSGDSKSVGISEAAGNGSVSGQGGNSSNKSTLKSGASPTATGDRGNGDDSPGQSSGPSANMQRVRPGTDPPEDTDRDKGQISDQARPGNVGPAEMEADKAVPEKSPEGEMATGKSMPAKTPTDDTGEKTTSNDDPESEDAKGTTSAAAGESRMDSTEDADDSADSSKSNGDSAKGASAEEPEADEVFEVKKLLGAARQAMAKVDLASARESLDEAIVLASSEVMANEAEDLSKVFTWLEKFWSAAENSLRGLKAAEELKIQGQVLVVVEVRDDTLVVRGAGRNSTFKLNKLPKNLAIQLAERTLGKDNPPSRLAIAAYLLTGSRPDVKRARQLLSGATGDDVAAFESLIRSLR